MRLPSRRTLARAYDWLLVAAGVVVAFLATDPQARETLAGLGGYVTIGIGVANVLLNKLPRDRS